MNPSQSPTPPTLVSPTNTWTACSKSRVPGPYVIPKQLPLPAQYPSKNLTPPASTTSLFTISAAHPTLSFFITSSNTPLLPTLSSFPRFGWTKTTPSSNGPPKNNGRSENAPDDDDDCISLMDMSNGLLSMIPVGPIRLVESSRITIRSKMLMPSSFSVVINRQPLSGRLWMSEVVRMLAGVGLSERLEEWQKQEMFRCELNHTCLRDPNWTIADSFPNIRPDELSGPR